MKRAWWGNTHPAPLDVKIARLEELSHFVDFARVGSPNERGLRGHDVPSLLLLLSLLHRWFVLRHQLSSRDVESKSNRRAQDFC